MTSTLLRLPFQDKVVELRDDGAFTQADAAAFPTYTNEHRLDADGFFPTSRHGVLILNDNNSVLSSCGLVASGGPTVIHERSALIHGDSLLVAVGPFVVALALPALHLRWKLQADKATCFGIYHSQSNHCYVSHGELEIARIAYDGTVEWSESGRDIFINGITLTNDTVEASDFNGDRYTWDIRNGQLIAGP